MHRNNKVWVVDDDSSIRWVLERALTQAGIDNESFVDGDQLLARLPVESRRALASRGLAYERVRDRLPHRI